MNDEKGWLDRRPSKGTFWLMVAIALAVMVFLLWEEHKVHLLGALPWLVVLACPLMHLFMHGGHGGHKGPGKPGDGPDD
ncbi:DUF2933 domain-containing protein [Halomonas nitroreducens]|uniref:DUF2933 domain-containing protein n=1 Tax=Halomonas nitroreducens TaxID=447425 RepID=A0A3S0KNR3_9GAMM|nr:DUF2933 domain-containing protein [Halomonas nitroreducens]RTQ99615.1 DUF2933 domain-containing protein [Halomonas nitroreducens]